MPYTRRYDRRSVRHEGAVNFATCLVSDFSISSERTRAWSRFLFSFELAVLNLFYHLIYCWFRRNWNTWKASSKFQTTPLIRFLLRHAQEGNKFALHCTARFCYRQQIKLGCVNEPLRNTVYRTYGDRIGDVCVIQRSWSRCTRLQWGEIIQPFVQTPGYWQVEYCPQSVRITFVTDNLLPVDLLSQHNLSPKPPEIRTYDVCHSLFKWRAHCSNNIRLVACTWKDWAVVLLVSVLWACLWHSSAFRVTPKITMRNRYMLQDTCFFIKYHLFYINI